MAPATAAATQLGISTLGTVYGVVQQQQNAAAQAKWQQQQSAAVQANATAAAVSQYSALLNRQNQENAAASQAIDANSRKAAAAAAAARVSAGEVGTAGNSVSALLDEYRQQELGFRQTQIRNATWASAQLKLDMDAVRANQQAAIAASAPKPVQAPDYLGALLRIGEASMDATTYYVKNKVQ
jgi:hypothetical protein